MNRLDKAAKALYKAQHDNYSEYGLKWKFLGEETKESLRKEAQAVINAWEKPSANHKTAVWAYLDASRKQKENDPPLHELLEEARRATMAALKESEENLRRILKPSPSEETAEQAIHKIIVRFFGGDHIRFTQWWIKEMRDL